jgi:hypothetical protein
MFEKNRITCSKKIELHVRKKKKIKLRMFKKKIELHVRKKKSNYVCSKKKNNCFFKLIKFSRNNQLFYMGHYKLQ